MLLSAFRQDEHQYYAFVKPSPRQYLTYLQMQGKLHVMSCENNDFYDDCVGMFGFHIVMCDGIVNVKEEIEKLHFKNEIIFDFQSLDQRTRTLGGNGMMVGSKNSSTSSHNTTLPIDEIFTISHKRKKRDLLQIDEKFFENMDEKRRIKKRLFYGDDVDIVKLATDGLEKDLPTRNAEEYIASRSSFQNAKKKKINEVSQYPAAVANEYGGTSGGQADANAADGENDNDKQQQEQTTPNNGNIFVAMKSKLMNLFGDFL